MKAGLINLALPLVMASAPAVKKPEASDNSMMFIIIGVVLLLVVIVVVVALKGKKKSEKVEQINEPLIVQDEEHGDQTHFVDLNRAIHIKLLELTVRENLHKSIAIRNDVGDFRYATNICQGQVKQLNLSDGSYYEGEVDDHDKFTGKGFLVYSIGDIQEGYWYNGKAEGEGRLIYADGGVYNGMWNDDECHGNGEIKYEDGSSYEGQWEHDKKDG
jgi:hypothetical protein